MRNEDPAQGITMKTSVVVMETGDNAGNGRRRLQPGATPRASDTIADSTSSLNLGAATTATENGYNEPPMELELGTVLPIEWTSQHACGPNDKTSCEIVLQYGCDATLAANGMPGLRDGTTTGCPNNGDQCPPLDNDEDQAANGDTESPQYGQHEAPIWYQTCRNRERNKGLFTADQNLNNRNQARSTRQNPNGGRSGAECPEERDYYPYWWPSPWRDIAVLTSNISRCEYYAANSQNTLARLNPPGVGGTQPPWCMLDNCPGDVDECAACNDEACIADKCTCGACTAAGVKPVCMESFWNRDNHLGGGIGGQANLYNWTLPTKTTGLREATPGEEDQPAEFDRCVFRMRYNITTGDTGLDLEDSIAYWDLTSSSNGDDSPVQQDEAVNVPAAAETANAGQVDLGAGTGGGADQDGTTRTLQLALNTNQYGRIFEDRSMVFHLVDYEERADLNRRRRRTQMTQDPKLDEEGKAAYEDGLSCSTTHNLEVRGKRGNIVQSFPGVEHDFDPSPLTAETGDCIELTIHLTDNDPPNNAGEGLPGSGRANLALTETGDKNVPVTDYLDPVARPDLLFPNEEAMFRWSYLGQESLTTPGGQPACLSEDTIEDNNEEQNVRNCGKLNPIGPEYNAGRIELENAGTWHFMSTRENNFSNRSHKSQIIVVEALGVGEKVGIAAGAIIALGAVGAAAFMGYKKSVGGAGVPAKGGSALATAASTPARPTPQRGAAPKRPDRP